MENPVAEIPEIIHLLCQSPPHLQAMTLQRYFTPSASFAHPFCRTGSYDITEYFEGGRLERVLNSTGMGGVVKEVGNSRGLIGGIYRWYKILSPKIELEVDSVAYDEKAFTLYVSIHQKFRIPYIPFFSAPVSLVTVLKLVPRSFKGSDKKQSYLIASQNDLYQVNEFFKFFSLFRVLYYGLMVFQFVATAVCVIGQAVLRPVVWWEEGMVGRHGERQGQVLEEIKE